MTSDECDRRVERLQAGLDALPPVARSVENGMLHETREFRGLTKEQAMIYLENLGGTRREGNQIAGDGWMATLSTRKVSVGSYRLTTVRITWVGDRDVLEPIIFRFRLKTFRAPG